MRCCIVLLVGAVLILLSSCAPHGAGLAPADRAGVDSEIGYYVKNFNQFEVDYFSHVGPTAIVFDRKNDAYSIDLEGKYWEPVPNREALQELVEIMQNGYGMGSFVRAVTTRGENGVAGVIYTPGIARVGSKGGGTLVVRPVWKEMACVGQVRARILGEGLCYPLEDRNRTTIFPHMFGR